MATSYITVGVVAVRLKLDNPWIDHDWRAHAVLVPPPETAPPVMLLREGENELWYLGEGHIQLHSGETAHYRDNLTAAEPRVWVALRPDGQGGYAVAGVTVDPYEGEAFAENVDDRIEGVPMPPAVMAEVTAFFDTHHVERPFFKRQRHKQDADSLGRRGVVERGVYATRRGSER